MRLSEYANTRRQVGETFHLGVVILRGGEDFLQCPTPKSHSQCQVGTEVEPLQLMTMMMSSRCKSLFILSIFSVNIIQAFLVMQLGIPN